MKHNITISIGNELTYGDFEHLYDEIRRIGGIHIIENINIIEANTKKSIKSLSNNDTKNRLVKLCSAIEYNLTVNVSIDSKCIFTSMDDLIRVLRNMNFNFSTLRYDLSYYKDHIKKALDQDQGLDQVIIDYQNAKLIGEVIDDYSTDNRELY